MGGLWMLGVWREVLGGGFHDLREKRTNLMVGGGRRVCWVIQHLDLDLC